MNRWPFKDNMTYESKTDRVLLHTPDEDFYYFSRQEPMGVGGMGYVLRGWSCKDNRPVAIKRVHDRFAAIPDVRNRARNESRLAFRHPNLIEMLGIVESNTGKGPVFIISNFVRGVNIDNFVLTNLSHLSDEEREHRIVSMILPVLEALRYIHGYQISHLDIKPSNIMVENGRNVRLMDMGIALTGNFAAAMNPGDHSNSGSGLMGTPRYAAPEQFGISGFGQVSNRSDIYEFGITLYELITGNNPFTGLSLPEAMELHKKLMLPRHERISDRVLTVLRKATSPYQENRHADVDELIAELKESIAPVVPEGKIKTFLKKLGL